MKIQDSKFNFKITFAAFCAVVIGILIAFYYSNAQSKAKINFLSQEKELLIKDLTIMTADVDRLSALNEVNDIELQSARYRVQKLSDSIGRLNFTADKLREYKSEFRKYQFKIDSFKLKNNYLKYTNMQLANKYEDAKKQIQDLQGKSSSLIALEAKQRKQIQELNNELKVKNYLRVDYLEGNGYRLRGDKPILTNKASVVQKLRGCVFIETDSLSIDQEKVIYFQFLNPTKEVIQDSIKTISANGKVYSKRVELVLDGKPQMQVCDFITIPKGSLLKGTYTFNVLEDEKVLFSTEFALK